MSQKIHQILTIHSPGTRFPKKLSNFIKIVAVMLHCIHQRGEVDPDTRGNYSCFSGLFLDAPGS